MLVNSVSRTGLIAAALLLFNALPTLAQDDQHPGRGVYEKACAACHDQPTATKSPALETLKAMRPQALSFAINEGKMQAQAAGLSSQEKAALLEYLVGNSTDTEEWLAPITCPADRQQVVLGETTVAGFGFTRENRRQLTKTQAGLVTDDFKNLELAWSIAFPKATTLRSQPAVSGNTLFLPVADLGQLLAINIDGEPCVQWTYKNAVPLRTSAAMGEIKNGRSVIAVSDVAAQTVLLDAKTGEKIWSQKVGINPLSITTGTPVFAGEKIIVPVSQYEITVAGNPKHQCCTSHGAVHALDAETGNIIWTMHTMEDATPQRDRGDGVMLLGPSGAPIWNSPAVDMKRGLVFVGTGESTSEPAHKNTDAIIAIDINTGKIKWSYQATANDIFIMGCGGGRQGPNCPKPEDTVMRDVDFGASMILATTSKGRDIVLGGQKSGTVWALDRETGEVLWKNDLGEGSPLGGIHWGIAYDGKQVFAPINRPFGFAPRKDTDKSFKPGLYVLDVDSGKLNWKFEAEPVCDDGRKERVKACDSNFGFSAAPTVIDGAVVTASLDGLIRVFNKDTGKLLLQYDAIRDYETLNGVEGKAGSFDAGSTVAVNGTLIMQSGYGMFGQMPGNLLLGFKKK